MTVKKPTYSRKEPEPVYEPTPVIRRPKTLMCKQNNKIENEL